MATSLRNYGVWWRGRSEVASGQLYLTFKSNASLGANALWSSYSGVGADFYGYLARLSSSDSEIGKDPSQYPEKS